MQTVVARGCCILELFLDKRQIRSANSEHLSSFSKTFLKNIAGPNAQQRVDLSSNKRKRENRMENKLMEFDDY